MSEPPTDPTSDSIKAMALSDAEALSRIEEAVLPETWELNRWILASLLALNSGGAATVYAATMDPSTKTWLYRLFGLGALAALSSGLALTFVLGRVGKNTTRAVRYWRAVSIDGIRSESDEAEINAAAIKRDLLDFMPQLLLVASAVLFVTAICLLP